MRKPDATAVVAAFRSGRLSPRAYAEQVQGRAQDTSNLNALTAVDPALPDRADAVFRANPDAPLAGLPIVVKDNIDAKGFTTTAGTPALAGAEALADAPCVAALQGAVVAAKAAMHELAFGITSNNAWSGPVRNPVDPSRFAGGSSGGTAAAIAANVVPAGLGTDTGGSCRTPAALCGVVGFRPSSGRYDGGGIVPISRTKDTPGPMARSVRDIALLDGLLANDMAPCPEITLSDATFGIPRQYFFDELDDEVAAAIEAAMDLLSAMGARMVDVDLAAYGRMNEDCGGPIALSEVMVDLPDYLATYRPGISFDELLAHIASPDVRAIFLAQRNAPIAEDAYHRALTVLRPGLRMLFESVFETHGLDALLLPTTALVARSIGEDETVLLAGKPVSTFSSFIRNTDPASNIGAPSISLPLPVDGLPVGLMLEAQLGQDRKLLGIAAAVEKALGAVR